MAGVDFLQPCEPDRLPRQDLLPAQLLPGTRSWSCPNSALFRDWVQALPTIRSGSLSARSASIDLGALHSAAAMAVRLSKHQMQQALAETAPQLPHHISRKSSHSGDVQALTARAQDHWSIGETPRASNDDPREAKVAAGTIRPHAKGSHSGAGVPADQRCPPHGIKAICGRRPRMEDAFSAIPFLLELPVPQSKSAQSEIYPARMASEASKSAAGSPSSDSGLQALAAAAAAAKDEPAVDGKPDAPAPATPWDPYFETLHFFGVFDGHGGADAAVHCAQTLHQRIVEAVTAATGHMPTSNFYQPQPPAAQPEAEKAAQHTPPAPPAAPAAPPDDANEPLPLAASRKKGPRRQPEPESEPEPEPQPQPEPNTEPVQQPAQEAAGDPHHLRPLSHTESDALIKDSLEEHEALGEQLKVSQDGKATAACTTQEFQEALAQAFSRVDEEFGKGEAAALVGTTVVVALVGSRHLYVANCGDSRAVLCRGDVAMPLTDDHKAAREDEVARIEALGGQILYWNGVRVMGVLAVSRAVGDHCLRPYVIAQPEVTIVARRPDDELLLLASDGLWDVLSNQEAVTLAKRCLRRALQRGATRQSAARIAATVLTRAAFDRGSRDNVTAVVIDLGAFQDLEPSGTASGRPTPDELPGSKGVSEDGALTADLGGK